VITFTCPSFIIPYFQNKSQDVIEKYSIAVPAIHPTTIPCFSTSPMACVNNDTYEGDTRFGCWYFSRDEKATTQLGGLVLVAFSSPYEIHHNRFIKEKDATIKFSWIYLTKLCNIFW